MPHQPFSVTVRPPRQSHDVAFNFDKQVVVVLGANGSGKSTLLQCLAQQCRTVLDMKAIYFEGGRAVVLPEKIEGAHGNRFGSIDQTEVYHDPKDGQGFFASGGPTRLEAALHLLRHVHYLEMEVQHRTYRSYYDEKLSSTDERLLQVELPFEQLARLFSLIFPDLAITYDRTNHLQCKKGASIYPAAQMSDGERQVLALLCEAIAMRKNRVTQRKTGGAIVIVDEPELNLNPGLAVRAWRILECEYSDAVFVYATHSVFFASSKTQANHLLLQGVGVVRYLSGLTDLPKAELSNFLGNVGGVILHERMVFVEGEDGSADRAVYDWIFADMNMRIVPVGNCDQVKAAVAKSGPWEILGTLAVAGIVDQDYGRKDALDTVVVTPYHEVESFLLHPDVICVLADRRGYKPLERSEVEAFLVESWRGSLLRTCMTRVFGRISTRYAPSSLRKSFADSRKTVEACHDLIRAALAEENSKITSPDEAVSLFKEEMEIASLALNERDTEMILRLMPAKQTLGGMTRLLGVPSLDLLLDAVRKYINPVEIDCLRQFRDMVEDKLH
jgi:ABC-type dipeptide/oligopeptide/nickel transport system ATPase component